MTNNGKSCWNSKTAADNKSLFFWSLSWTLSTALAGFGPKVLWDFATIPTILGVIVNIGLGLGLMRAFVRYLNGLDELLKQIQLEALAITCGLTMVLGLAYELLEDIKLMSGEPQVSFLIIFMSLCYIASAFYRKSKYA